MPKKSAATRGGTQRSKPKAQKSFELVRPVTEENEPEIQEAQEVQESEVQNIAELAAANVSSTTIAAPVAGTSATATPTNRRTTTKPSAESVSSVEEAVAVVQEPVSIPTPAPKGSGSASARIAARRQATQKVQQRVAVPLVTVEHYSYVRRDLIFIAVLACIMFAIIITLHFVPGIGY